VLDDARMLERCLDALERQSRPADEVVVVDNGSSDDSAAVAIAHGARVVAESIRGIPRAASAGYDAARGEVIARLDADSVPGPDWLERIERTFREHRGVDFVTGDPRFTGANAVVHWVGEHLYIGAMYAVLSVLFGHAPLFGSNMAMRAEAWRTLSPEVHRDAQRIHDDLDLTLHIRPEMGVLHDRRLVVAVSARPFESLRSLGRRLSWVLPTFRLHWRHESLLAHRRARRRAVRAGGAG